MSQSDVLPTATVSIIDSSLNNYHITYNPAKACFKTQDSLERTVFYY